MGDWKINFQQNSIFDLKTIIKKKNKSTRRSDAGFRSKLSHLSDFLRTPDVPLNK